MNTDTIPQLPLFLQSFDEFTAHFDAQFSGLGSNERGDQFLLLARKIVPLTDDGQRFPRPEPSERKSHDDGIDLITPANEQNRVLGIQSRYKISGKDDLDSIVSKFSHFESIASKEKDPNYLFPDSNQHQPTLEFMIVTSSKLKGVLDAYLASSLTSKVYYQKLVDERRLSLVDGPAMLRILQRLYRKAHLLPTNVTLYSVSPWLNVGTVRLGIVRGTNLVELHQEHGDSLFFENIRDFLGMTSGKVADDRSTVNQEISRTISESPGKMLERNNGVTFRAQSVVVSKDNENTLLLTNAGIVNGCQTTMCLVNCAPRTDECLVQVKVVVTSDAWDVAKAANNQNPVARIELDLAKYLRPQLVKKAATDIGYGIGSPEETTASGVLDTIHRSRIEYEEMKCLYLGLFSRKPNNLFDNNYTELRADLLEQFYQDPNNEANVFSTLFLILQESRKGLQRCEEIFSSEEYGKLFKRFFQDDKPRYRAYLAILAVCGATRQNVGERSPELGKEVERMDHFFQQARKTLENDKALYSRRYLLAFEILADCALDASSAGNEAEVAQGMFQKISKTGFQGLFTKLLLRIDSDKALRDLP